MQQQNVQIRTELARQVQAQGDLPRLAEQLGDAVQKLSDERKDKSSAPAFSLVDTKGLGKPSIFKNEEAKFLEWYRKTNAYLTAVFGEQFRKLLEWVEDQAQETTVISMEVLEARFGSDDDDEDEFIPDLREKVSQLYVALQTLTEGESFALVMNTPKGNGAEAMRKLIRRWGPASGGKRRVLLKQIMNPQRCTLSDLYAKLEEWEELIRRYERKKADGQGKVVDDDVKVAALETMVPEELELHLAMNKHRLDTSEKVVEEIRSFLESRQSQGALLRRKRGDPMDVDSLYKGGKGKSKGKGDKNGKKGQTTKPRDKRTAQCWRCGGWGHTSNECTARLTGGKTGDGKGSKGKGKGKDLDKDKGKGKNRRWDTNSFEPGAASSSSQPVYGDNWDDGNNSTITSLPPSASQVGSTNLGSFELCTFELNSFDETVDDQEWVRFTFDSGAAVTTFPENTKGERLPADPNASYRTASGEIIADSGGVCIQGRSEWSEPIRLKARLASIHKPLVSASQTHRTGRATWLTKEGGYILPAGSDIVNRVDALIRDAVWSESGVVPLYVEKGIYAGYIKKNEGGHVRRVSFGDHRESWDLCPVEVARRGRAPTQAEREQHLASGHAVYRSWCEECVRAAGLGAQHARRPEDRDDADPVVSMDFAFIGEKVQDVEDDGSIPILVVTDRKYGVKGATAVKDKTASDFVVKWLVGFLKHLGHRRVVLKSDGEASICAIKNAVMVGVGQHVECIPQESPKGEHKSNGEVEASVKEVKKVIRANFFSMQKSFGFEVSPGHPIVRWLPQFAADSISKFRLGVDGMSAEQRRCGRPWRKFAAEFGERVHYRPLGVGDERSTLAPKMLMGHFVGYHSRTGALLVMTQSGVVQAQGFKRLHRAQAWSPETPGSWGKLAGLPWEVSPAVLLAQPVGPIIVTRDTQEDHDTVVRRRYVLKRDIERFGANPGCPGCADLMARGSARVAHSQECRDRIEAELMKDSAGQRRLAEHHLRASAREAQAEESAAQPAPQPGAAAASGGGAAAASGGGGAAARPGADVAMAGPRAGAPATSPAASRKRAASVSAEERRPPQLRDGPRGLKRAGSEPDLHGQMIVDGGSSSSAGPASAAVSAGLVQPVPSPEGARGGGDMEDLAGPAARAGSSMDVGAFDEVKGKIYREILALVSATDLIGDNVMSIKELKEVSALLTEINGVDLAEVYSPERFKGKALGMGLTAGLAADLYTGWDLLREDHRRAVMKKLLEEDPLLTVTSPPCTVFSKLRQLSNFKRDEGIVASEVLEGETHLEFSMKVCESRHQRGALFLHEHPWGASSWSRPCVQRVKELPGVYWVRGPMCRWGLHARGPDGREAFVRKETGWLTNSQVLADILAGECRCQSIGGEPYRHVHLLGDRRARKAQVYPPRLVRAILRGLREELRARESLSDLAGFTAGPSPHAEDMDQEAEAFVDDVRGGFLDPLKVKEARAEELEWCRSRGVWKKVPRREMEAEGGRAIDTRWIDTNKGDLERPLYRSRLVAREMKVRRRAEGLLPPQQDLFSGTPPLEAFKALVSLFLSRAFEQFQSSEPREVLYKFYDVSRAHFYGHVQRRLWVELPPEERQGEEEPLVGLLLRTMYGTMAASQVWQGDYVELLKSVEFLQGKSSPAILWHPGRDIALEVHGDDFGVLMYADDEAWFDELLKKYDYKVTGRLSSAAEGVQSSVYLNRVLIWDPAAVEARIESDVRHVAMILRDLHLRDAKPVQTPAVKKSVTEMIEASQSQTLDDAQSKLYRSLVMRASYIGQDRPDLSYIASSLAKSMKTPRESDMMDLKRLGRYLKQARAGSLVFKLQEVPTRIEIFVDADWAGEATTRKSRSGMMLMLGSHLVKHASTQQTTVALSSGESEYYAMLKGASHALGLQSMLQDFGVQHLEMPLLRSGSVAAEGIATRQGLGAVCHIDTRFLWLQDQGWQLGRWSKISESNWVEQKTGQPALPPAMFEALTGGPVCPGSTTVRLRMIDCPEDDQIEALILDTSLQVFRGGQYVGEYMGGYESAVEPMGEAPLQQSSFNSSAPAEVTMQVQTIQASPVQTLRPARSAGATQKAGFDRSPAKVCALHSACSGGDAAAVKALLDQRVDPDAPGEKGKTALLVAATAGSLPVAELLLAAGADPNVGSEDGQTPLVEAFRRGHKAVMSKLFSSTLGSLRGAPRDLGAGGTAEADDAVPANAHHSLMGVTMKLSRLGPTTQDRFYSPARRDTTDLTRTLALDPATLREQQLKNKMCLLAENSPSPSRRPSKSPSRAH
ncbi:unnamed protein product [Prorocentrum cordatum]|uniref:CCHC-type domain-containing protein n=1 Tax=Prorocentrum cordatum TaxID=2364126 RepID=A0ABN9RNF2_9DINO|nr:unnamed protein product [Polarella glacialis]